MADAIALKISDIDVSGRSRKTLGDIPGLAGSIERLGLLHPIVVTPEKKLIVGRRRIEAYKLLGFSEIPAHVVKTISELSRQLEAERDENGCREPYTPEEIVHLGARFEELERKAAKERQGRPESPRCGKLPQHEVGKKTRDVVGKAAGVSGRTYEKAKAVVASGDRALIDEMNRTGKVNGVHKKLNPPAEKPRPQYPESDYFNEWLETIRMRSDGIVMAEGGLTELMSRPGWDHGMDGLLHPKLQGIRMTLAKFDKEMEQWRRKRSSKKT
jgi:hypothetical protein